MRWLRPLLLVVVVLVALACGGGGHGPDPDASAVATAHDTWPPAWPEEGAKAWTENPADTAVDVVWTAPLTEAARFRIYSVDVATGTSTLLPSTPIDFFELPWTELARGARHRVTGLAGCTAYRFRIELGYLDGDAGTTVWTGTFLETLHVTAGGLAPGAATPSPALTDAPTDFHQSTAWIYGEAGSNRLQMPVDVTPPDVTIDPARVGVVSGTVRGVGGPIGCIGVTVLGEPKCGATKSLADGTFHLAANGGGLVTLKFTFPGFLDAYRTVRVPVHDYARADDVVLIAHDKPATTVSASATDVTVVEGSTYVEPSTGTARTARVFFPAGTTAVAGGTDLTSYSVQVTEFTVGPDGPVRMPAPLPPASAYTYAAALNVRGYEGQQIKFKKGSESISVPFYVENFLDFPVGWHVPVGFFEESANAWVPSESGWVVEIIGQDCSTTPCKAVLDANGDGIESSVDVARVGNDPQERAKLAALYSVGTSLWRAMLPHFSRVDLNWGRALATDASRPKGAPYVPELDDPCLSSGSIIECENQALGEAIPIPGTGLSLHYSSRRHVGVPVPVVVPFDLPSQPDFLGSVVDVKVLGKSLPSTGVEYGPGPRRTHHFAWNGLDPFGKPVSGAVAAKVRIGFTYKLRYTDPETFGKPCTGTCPTQTFCVNCDATRDTTTLWSEYTVPLSGWNDDIFGIGGWSLSAWHAFHKDSGRVFYGDGSMRGGVEGLKGLTPLDARIDQHPPNSFGRYAAIAAGPGGSVYVLETVSGATYLRKVAGGAAGTVTCKNSAGLIIEDCFPYTASELAIGADGYAYVSLGWFVYRIRLSGGEHTEKVVDLSDPVEAGSGPISAMALAPDGTLYLGRTLSGVGGVDVHPPGTAPESILRLIGGGTHLVDGSPATSLKLSNVDGVAVGPDGSVYVSTDQVSSGLHSAFPGGSYVQEPAVLRMAPTGAVSIVFGGKQRVPGEPMEWPSADGSDAVGFKLQLRGPIAVAIDGTIFKVEVGTPSQIFLADRDGKAYALTGTVGALGSGDGGLARNAVLTHTERVAYSSDGGLYVLDGLPSEFVRVIRPTVTGIVASAGIPSADGSLLHEFDARGMLLRTRSTTTNVVLTSIEYDSVSGRPIAVRDAYGNATTLAWSGGRLSTITAPFGQPTSLAYHADGKLHRVTAADGAIHELTYDPGNGLLATYLDPRGKQYGHTAHSFSFDTDYRLYEDCDPSSNCQTLARTPLASGWRVTLTSAAGRPRVHETLRDLAGVGSVLRRSWNADGALTAVLQTEDAEGNLLYRRQSASQAETFVSTKVDTRFGSLVRYDARTEAQTTSGAPLLSKATTGDTDGDGVPNADDACPAAPGSKSPDPSKNGCPVSRVAVEHERIVDPPHASSPGLLTSIEDKTTLVPTDGGLSRVWRSKYVRATNTITLTSPLGRTSTIELEPTEGTWPPTSPSASSQGLPKSATVAPLAPVTFSWDKGRLAVVSQCVGPTDCRTLTYAFSPSGAGKGYLQTVTHSGTLLSTFVRDAAGRATSASLPGARTVSASWDKDGALASFTPPGRPAHGFSYDERGLFETYAPPTVAAPVSYGFSLLRGLDGEPKETHEGAPTALSKSILSWDVDGRKGLPGKLAFHEAGGPATQYGVQFKYDDASRLVRVQDGTGAYVAMTYDGALPIQQSIAYRVPGGAIVERDLGVTYDGFLRPKTATLSGEPAIAFDYDGDGLVTQVGSLFFRRTTDGTATGPVRNDGRVTKTEVGGVATTYLYDGYGLPKGTIGSDGSIVTAGIETQHGSTALFRAAYAYDARGRIVKRTEQKRNGSGALETSALEYEYSPEGWLKDVYLRTSATTRTLVASHSYDTNGNKKPTTTAIFDDQDRLTTLGAGGATFEYTPEGRLWKRKESGKTTTYGYDLRGSLASVERKVDATSVVESRVDYLNDPLGRRVGRKANGGSWQLFVYGGGLGPVAMLDQTGALVARFVYASRPNVPDYAVYGSKTYRLVHDHLGSVVAVVDSSTGTVVHTMRYAADGYGTLEIESVPGDGTYSAANAIPFGFAGGIHDRETKLVRFGARDYTVDLARWLARDPALVGGGANFWRYAGSDPVNYIDADGRTPIFVAVSWGAFAGSVGGFMASYLYQSLFGNGDIDGGDVSISAGFGFIGGAAGGAGLAPGPTGAALGVLQQLASDAYHNRPPNATSLLCSAGLGGLGGFIGGAVRLKSGYVSSTSRVSAAQKAMNATINERDAFRASAAGSLGAVGRTVGGAITGNLPVPPEPTDAGLSAGIDDFGAAEDSAM